MMSMSNKALAALASRGDLLDYGPNAALLYALQLRWAIADIDGVAAVALTDSANDKKCDLVYVDRDDGRIIVAQGYMAEVPRASAPANKASDLNTAVAWLLSGPLDGLPEVLQSAAADVRDALSNDEINEFHVWYVHNLPESNNVKVEVEQAAVTASSLIKSHFRTVEVEVTSLEIGLQQLERLYERTEAPIAVTDRLKLTVRGGFETSGEHWRAYTTAVPGTWLREQWEKYGSDLMSPNVREYLGIVRSERNINNGIKTTASQTPDRFWIYNNGVTILVHDYTVTRSVEGDHCELEIQGMGIVNGAQTTGSIATLSDADAPGIAQTQVLARFVKCDDGEVLGDIVKFNNTQNKVEAADFRSKDAVQDRLRSEFVSVPDADYRGARRGGIKDAIERSTNRLPDSAVAQALAAFQLAPNVAYNETRRIWEENSIYSRFFSDRTTARNVVFCYSLLRALEAAKKRLGDIPESDRTEAQQRHTHFFRKRGSIALMAAAISKCIEQFLDRPVPDRMALRFRDNCSPKDAADRWLPIIEAALSFSNQLIDATDLGLKNSETVTKALDTFQGMIEATANANRERYDLFAQQVDVIQ